ncbi:unnamed protein product, partial [Rotaria sp. Silwood2]
EHGQTYNVPPDVALKYNCISKVAILFIQWSGTLASVNLAVMYIKDLTSNDIEQYKWHWQEQQINTMNNKLANNHIELNAFKDIIGEIKI